MTPIKIVIGHHLAELRKQRGLTQAELANEFGYTDKAVSKWEHGETMPDFDVLAKLCEYYGITMAERVTEGNLEDIQTKKKRRILTAWTKWAIVGLSMMVVWLIAVLGFFILQAIYNHLGESPAIWIVFLWAVPASLVVGLIFNGIWGFALMRTVLITSLVWSLIACLYIQLGLFMADGTGWQLWGIFFIGIPPTIAAFLWYSLSANQKRHRDM